MTAEEFFATALPWATQAHQATGVLTSVILAQWADETGFGGPDWSPNNNPGNVGSFDGKPVATFPTLADGVAAYIALMNAPDRPAFGATISKATTYQEQAFLLGSADPVWATGRYGTPPGSSLVDIIQTYDLERYDAPPPQPTPPVPSPVPPSREEEDMALAISADGKTIAAVRTDGHLVAFTAGPSGGFTDASVDDLTDRAQATDAPGGPWTFPTS